MEDDRGMAMEFESMVCIQNLGGRQILRFMTAGLCGGGVGGGSGVFQRMFLVTKVLVPNIKQAKTHQPKIAFGDVMCGFSSLVYWHHFVCCMSKVVCGPEKNRKQK